MHILGSGAYQGWLSAILFCTWMKEEKTPMSTAAVVSTIKSQMYSCVAGQRNSVMRTVEREVRDREDRAMVYCLLCIACGCMFSVWPRFVRSGKGFRPRVCARESRGPGEEMDCAPAFRAGFRQRGASERRSDAGVRSCRAAASLGGSEAEKKRRRAGPDRKRAKQGRLYYVRWWMGRWILAGRAQGECF
jgi:hypothetical protein